MNMRSVILLIATLQNVPEEIDRGGCASRYEWQRNVPTECRLDAAAFCCLFMLT